MDGVSIRTNISLPRLRGKQLLIPSPVYGGGLGWGEIRVLHAPDSPRANAIRRMDYATEVAYVAALLASDHAWAVSGELVVATGAGRSDGKS